MKNKTVFAALCMVVLVIASIPLGIVRSVQSVKNDAQSEYYYDDTGFALYNGVQTRVETSESLIKVANKYVEDYPQLREKIENLEYALNKLDNIYSDINAEARENKNLDAPFNELADALREVELSSADSKYPDTLSAEMKSQQDKLARSSYNEKAAEYNSMLNNFPVSMMTRIGILEKMETFAY